MALFGLVNNIPEFSGNSNVSVGEFVDKVECFGGISKISEDKKVALAKLFLSGLASEFVRNNSEIKDTEDWSLFKKVLIDRFTSVPHFLTVERQFVRCCQLENESVLEYEERLREIANRLVSPTEEKLEQEFNSKYVEKRLFNQFLIGLVPRLQRDVLLAEPKILIEAVKIAKRLEVVDHLLISNANREISEIRAVKNTQKEFEPMCHPNFGNGLCEPEIDGRSESKAIDKLAGRLTELLSEVGASNSTGPLFENSTCRYKDIMCFRCQTIGHIARHCSYASSDCVDSGVDSDDYESVGLISTKSRFRNRMCFRCQKMGHIARFCKRDISRSKNKICYNCREYGHIAVGCSLSVKDKVRRQPEQNYRMSKHSTHERIVKKQFEREIPAHMVSYHDSMRGKNKARKTRYRRRRHQGEDGVDHHTLTTGVEHSEKMAGQESITKRATQEKKLRFVRAEEPEDLDAISVVKSTEADDQEAQEIRDKTVGMCNGNKFYKGFCSGIGSYSRGKEGLRREACQRIRKRRKQETEDTMDGKCTPSKAEMEQRPQRSAGVLDGILADFARADLAEERMRRMTSV